MHLHFNAQEARIGIDYTGKNFKKSNNLCTHGQTSWPSQ